MTKDILEKAFEKTKEIEEKQLKKMKVAKALGLALGWIAATAIDALAVWAILKFMVGATVGFLPVLGGMFLLNLGLHKIKWTLK